MNRFWNLVLGFLAFIFLVSNCVYIVSEREKGVLLEFKKIVQADIKPGLHFKMPFVQEVRRFDARLQLLDAHQQTFLTQEKKFLDVDYYMTWRVNNVEKYFTSTGGDQARAASLLAPRIEKGLRDQFGERTMHEVITSQREQVMQELTDKLNQVAQQELGIDVVDIRVKRVDLPSNVSDSVFQRMSTEREQLANEYRSNGQKQKVSVEAEANRQRDIILAEARRDAEKVRGEGDATASVIYSNAYSLDSEFYGFYRSMQAYREVFKNKQDMLVLEPDSDFFKYLNDANKMSGLSKNK